jgi:predicted transposase/invertase (TIGR01784 family)
LVEVLEVLSGVPVDQKIIDFRYTTTYYLYITKEFMPESLREAFKRAKFEQSDYEVILMTTAERLREEGELRGVLKGKIEGKIEAAMKMKDKGIDIDTILEITGLSLDDLKKAGIAA